MKLKGKKVGKQVKKLLKQVDKPVALLYNNSCVTGNAVTNFYVFGVWLSLARAPGLGPGGR
ncbi:MAG: hypothetical protein RR869_09475, partial [Lachnospiraceae bacterium]